MNNNNLVVFTGTGFGNFVLPANLKKIPGKEAVQQQHQQFRSPFGWRFPTPSKSLGSKVQNKVGTEIVPFYLASILWRHIGYWTLYLRYQCLAYQPPASLLCLRVNTVQNRFCSWKHSQFGHLPGSSFLAGKQGNCCTSAWESWCPILRAKVWGTASPYFHLHK